MRKFACFALILAVLICFAGCAGAPATSAAQSAGEPGSASVAASTASPPPASSQPETDVSEALLVEAVNLILARYANGSLPEKVVLAPGDVYGIGKRPPADCVLPEKITIEDLTYRVEEGLSGKYVVANLLLANDYRMELGGNVHNDGTIVIDGVHFFDERDITAMPEIEVPSGGRFTNVTCSRIWRNADFEGITAHGEALPNGSLEWDVPSRYVVLTLGVDINGRVAYYYDIDEDGTLSLAYSMRSETAPDIAAVADLLRQFEAALQNAGVGA